MPFGRGDGDIICYVFFNIALQMVWNILWYFYLDCKQQFSIKL